MSFLALTTRLLPKNPQGKRNEAKSKPKDQVSWSNKCLQTCKHMYIYISYSWTTNILITIWWLSTCYHQLICFVFHLLAFLLQPGECRSGASACGYRHVCANTLSEDPWREIPRGDFDCTPENWDGYTPEKLIGKSKMKARKMSLLGKRGDFQVAR